jgi:hypothetical protein
MRTQIRICKSANNSYLKRASCRFIFIKISPEKGMMKNV